MSNSKETASTENPALFNILPNSAFKLEAIPVWVTLFGLSTLGYFIVKK